MKMSGLAATKKWSVDAMDSAFGDTRVIVHGKKLK